jgi:hypothetical protein
MLHAMCSDNMLDVDNESLQVSETMPPQQVKIVDSQQKHNVTKLLMAAHNNNQVSQMLHTGTAFAVAGASHPSTPMAARQVQNNQPIKHPCIQGMDLCCLIGMDEGLICTLALCELLTDIIEYKINLATANALDFGKPCQLKSKLYNLVKIFIFRIGTYNQ